MYEDLKSRIKKHEGFLAKVYLDSLGKATIGYGHLLTEDGKSKCKGRFEFANLAMHKNKSFLVIPKWINGLNVFV